MARASKGKQEDLIGLTVTDSYLDKKRVKDRLLSSPDRGARSNINQPLIEFVSENKSMPQPNDYYDELNERFGDTNELAPDQFVLPSMLHSSPRLLRQ
jgi:hypothetical protein